MTEEEEPATDEPTFAVVACVRVLRDPRVLPGFPGTVDYCIYEQTECPVCRAQMWIGPRGKMRVALGDKALCGPCVENIFTQHEPKENAAPRFFITVTDA